VARLSSAESVLKKLSEVDQKLIDLYETVDLIKSLNDDLKKSYEKSKEYEVQLEKKLEEIDKLEKAHVEGIKELEDIAESSEEELIKIRTEFDEEKANIDEVLQPLISEKIDLEKMRSELKGAMSHVNQHINEKVSYFSTHLKTVISDSKNTIEQFCDDGKNRIDEELKQLPMFKDTLIKEIKDLKDHIKNDLDAFKNEIDSDLKVKTDDLLKQQGICQQTSNQKIDLKISEEKENLRISTENKIDEFLGRQKNLIGNLTQRIDSFVGIAADLQTRLRKTDEKQRQVISVINKQKNYIMKLNKRILQIEQTTVSDLERRIGTIESTLEEMQQKRRFWPFSK
jgi:chromosome segregation ATPase